MSHPDPQHDSENERQDDVLLRDEFDAMRMEYEDSRIDGEHACAGVCQLFEHKGYRTCSLSGRCELYGGQRG